MKKFLPIVVVVAILAGASYFLLFKDDSKVSKVEVKNFKFSEFNRVKSCASMPRFLYKAGVKRPVIDLSQEKFTGIAFYYNNFRKVLHKKSWERFEYLGTYAIDRVGNIYLTPNPFISIKPTTFNLQKAVYKLDSINGELTRWLVIDDIKPTQNNPYGLISIAYDCNDGSLYVSAIDKSNYKGSFGRIYKINPKDKSYKKVIDNFDALTLYILKTKDKKYLLAGSAMDNALYAFEFKGKNLDTTPHKLLSLPNPELHIRKIKAIGKNTLQLEAIKFSYSLIAASDKKKRVIYIATYNPNTNRWSVKEVK